jgi:two-component system CheB/CheR fusion protein
MNEELQSTNEELQTINDEVRRRSDELNHVNAFLEAILAGMRGAVVVLDADLGVLVWNRGAEDLWGVRADEVAGKHFFNLDVGLPVGELRHALRQAIAGESLAEPVTLRATNRRGKPFDCRVTVTSFHASDHTRGAILMLE